MRSAMTAGIELASIAVLRHPAILERSLMLNDSFPGFGRRAFLSGVAASGLSMLSGVRHADAQQAKATLA